MGPYAPGDLIWGKVKGLPWWPGQIMTCSQARCLNPRFNDTPQQGKQLISFFGDYKYNWLPEEDLRDFTRNYDEFRAMKRMNKVRARARRAAPPLQRGPLTARAHTTPLPRAPAPAPAPST
jgi:hypothetical protein